MEMQRAIDTAYESLFEGVSMADAEEEMGKEENELNQGRFGRVRGRFPDHYRKEV